MQDNGVSDQDVSRTSLARCRNEASLAKPSKEGRIEAGLGTTDDELHAGERLKGRRVSRYCGRFRPLCDFRLTLPGPGGGTKLDRSEYT